MENNQIPDRLIQKDRPVDLFFSNTEILYHRFPKLLDDIDGYIYPSTIRFPNFSVNRSKYSESYDVLIPKYFDWGIYSFQVQDIPQPITNKETTYEFYAEHVPKVDNYSHSEVRVSKNGIYDEGMKISSKIVKKTFRFKLSDKATIIKYPE